jgi:hypothetical protein
MDYKGNPRGLFQGNKYPNIYQNLVITDIGKLLARRCPVRKSNQGPSYYRVGVLPTARLVSSVRAQWNLEFLCHVDNWLSEAVWLIVAQGTPTTVLTVLVDNFLPVVISSRDSSIGCSEIDNAIRGIHPVLIRQWQINYDQHSLYSTQVHVVNSGVCPLYRPGLSKAELAVCRNSAGYLVRPTKIFRFY